MSRSMDLDGSTGTDSSVSPPATEDSCSANRAEPSAAGPSATGADATGPVALGRLATARVFLLGKLAGMPRREVKRIIRQQGGRLIEPRLAKIEAQETGHSVRCSHAGMVETEGGSPGNACEAEVTMVVVGDNLAGWHAHLQQQYPAIALGVDSGRIELLQESEFWARVGLMDSQDAVRRLYTPAMLAELLAVPVAAIRRWYRQGTLVACRHVRRLPYFDFSEVSVARHLADLHKAGCSLRVIDRKLQELAAMMPDCGRPLAESGIVVEGRGLFFRRGNDLEEPGGQRQFEFDRLACEEDPETGPRKESIPLVVQGACAETAASVSGRSLPDSDAKLTTVDHLRQEAIQYEDQGLLDMAAETYRAILMAGGLSAEMNFSLADVLYRQGDYTAARERYYMAIEMDEEYVEARANLGCVLAELDELDMAVAAFQGALAYHADYADVHYHMAGALERLQRHEEAHVHWRKFLALAPESAWAEVARMRLAVVLD